MTPQDIQDLQNAVYNLQSAITQVSGSTGILANSLNSFQGSLSNIGSGLANATNGLNNAGQGFSNAGNTLVNSASQTANQMNQYNRIMADASTNFRASLGSFISGISNTTASLSNLQGAGGAAGYGLSALGSSLGINTSKLNTWSYVLQNATASVLGAAQAYLEAKNILNKFGAVGSETVDSLYTYAQAAGLAASTVNRMIGPMASLGGAISGLGNGAADAQRAFMEMLQTQSGLRQQFARVGIFQEEMMKRQADYVAAQDAAGMTIRDQSTDMNKLRSASLDYIKNLYELSSLTGKSVDQERDEQFAAMAERRTVLEAAIQQERINDLREEANRLEAEGNKDEAIAKRKQADEIAQDLENRQTFYRNLANLATPEQQKGVKELIQTGAGISPESRALIQQGVAPAILELADKLKNDPQELARQIQMLLTKGSRQAVSDLGETALLQPDEALQRAYGFGTPELQNLGRYRGRNLTKEAEDAGRRFEAAMGLGSDKVSNFTAKIQELSISLAQAADKAKEIAGFINKVDVSKQYADKIAEDRLARGQGLDDVSGWTGTFVEGLKTAAEEVNKFGDRFLLGLDQLGNLLHGDLDAIRQQNEQLIQYGDQGLKPSDSTIGRRGATPAAENNRTENTTPAAPPPTTPPTTPPVTGAAPPATPVTEKPETEPITPPAPPVTVVVKQPETETPVPTVTEKPDTEKKTQDTPAVTANNTALTEAIEKLNEANRSPFTVQNVTSPVNLYKQLDTETIKLDQNKRVPALLNGNRPITPVDTNALLADYNKKIAEKSKTETPVTENKQKEYKPTMDTSNTLANNQLVEALGGKLDEVSRLMSANNDILDRIYRQAQA